jgi:DNA-binding GntR family transcriptional regulator
MALLIRHQAVSLEHLAQFRTLLEGDAAEQAAQLAGEADLQALAAILDRIRAHIQTRPRDWEVFHDLDARFHQALARIAGNPLILATLATIHDNIHGYFHQYLPFSQSLMESDFQDLEQIMDAVAAGDVTKAGRVARNHVARFTRLMKENRFDHD